MPESLTKITDSKNKVFGIPRGFFYWQHESLWAEFFKELGLKLVSSGKTNNATIKQGVLYSEDESCFSYKVLFGAIVDLIQSGKIDVLFLPRYLSLEKDYVSCPKFAGIDSVVRCLPIKMPAIFSPTIDANRENIPNTLKRIGGALGFSASKSREASLKAWQAFVDEEEGGRRQFLELMSNGNKKVVIFGHRYILEDDFINFRLENKLGKFGVSSIPIYIVPYQERDKVFSWDFAAEEMGRLRSLDTGRISGIIQLSSFNCGPDSVIVECLRKFTKEKNIPFLHLWLDEDTGEAGVETRIEAFFDTINFPSLIGQK